MTTSEFVPQVEPEHYRGIGYNDKLRFVSYWMQIAEVMKSDPKGVLEIGIGSGFVHKFLRSHGVAVHTVDADPRLAPDTVALIGDLPFADRSFDVVCCFETLEHLPWDQFVPSVRQLARVSSRYVLVSVPDVTPYVRCRIEVGFLKRWVTLFKDLPNPLAREHRFQGEHYWEIGKKGYPVKRVQAALAEAGLVVESVARADDNPYHRFFRCRVPY
jgi:hypothetical protein